MIPPTPNELWTARRQAIDATISRIVHTIPEWASTADDWDIVELAVRMIDADDYLAEVDGRIELR